MRKDDHRCDPPFEPAGCGASRGCTGAIGKGIHAPLARADGEFASGRYRLRLTSAAVSASAGDWHLAIVELRQLVASPGKAGVTALLARSMPARLLARRGDPESGSVLDEALHNPVAAGDSHVAGPLAVAQEHRNNASTLRVGCSSGLSTG